MLTSAFPVLTEVGLRRVFEMRDKKSKKYAAAKLLRNEVRLNKALLDLAVGKDGKVRLTLDQSKALVGLLQTSALQGVYLDAEAVAVLGEFSFTPNEDSLAIAPAKKRGIQLKSGEEASSFILRKVAELKALASLSLEMPRGVKWNARITNLRDAVYTIDAALGRYVR